MKSREYSHDSSAPVLAMPTFSLLPLLLICIGAGCNPKEPPYPEVGIATQANTDAYNYYNRDRVALTGFPSHTTWHTGPYQGGSAQLNVYRVATRGRPRESK